MAASRNIGDLGEDDFQRWCTLNNLACSKPTRDRMGWDFFVEFKPSPVAGLALDAQGELKKILVQVKASNRMERSLLGKLSAFKQLVDADMPTFIVGMHYEGGREPRRAWLLHIGEAQIEAILRKVRETESKGRTDLHAVKFRLRLDQAVPLQVDGSDLSERLRNYIGSITAHYVAAKSAFRQTCGFDEMPFLGTVQLAPGVGMSQLADWQIGRIPNIRVQSGTVQKVRFGIALEKETQHFGEGLFRIDAKPVGKGLVSISSEAQAASAEMVTDLYCSDPLMGKDLWRMRYVNQFLDCYLPMQGSCNVSFDIDQSRRYALADLVLALKFGWLLSEPDVRLKFTIAENDLQQGMPIHVDSFNHFKNLYGIAERFATALHRYKQHLTSEISVREIEEALRVNEKAYSVLMLPGFGLSFQVADPAAVAAVAVRNGVIIMPVCMRLKGLVYHAVVRIEAANVSIDAAEVHFEGGHPHVVEDGIVLERDLPGLASRLNKRAGLLRGQENSQGRMVVGFQDVVVGLDDGEASTVTGAISW